MSVDPGSRGFLEHRHTGIVLGDGAWQVPVFQNSWAQYALGTWDANYRRLACGLVLLRGLIAGGAQNTIAFTLPVGYRPSRSQMFTCMGASGIVRSDVSPGGLVSIAVEVRSGTFSSAWQSINEMSFLAEQ